LSRTIRESWFGIHSRGLQVQTEDAGDGDLVTNFCKRLWMPAGKNHFLGRWIKNWAASWPDRQHEGCSFALGRVPGQGLGKTAVHETLGTYRVGRSGPIGHCHQTRLQGADYHHSLPPRSPTIFGQTHEPLLTLGAGRWYCRQRATRAAQAREYSTSS